MKTTASWIGRICALLALTLFVSLPQARSQATPPTGMPVQYAAPFGVLRWVNAEYTNDGVGRWEKITYYGLTATLTPNESGALDDLGNLYFALLDFQNSENAQNNAQYFAYVAGGGTELSLRLKLGSAGASPFPELTSAVLRDVTSVASDRTLYSGDGIGLGDSYAYWADDSYRIYMRDDAQSLVDSDGHLCFGWESEQLQYGIENRRYIYIDANGSLFRGDVLTGWVGGFAYPHVIPSGMASVYFWANGAAFTWQEEYDGWVGVFSDFQGNQYYAYMHMETGASGVLVIAYVSYDSSFYDVVYLEVARDAGGVLTVHGSGIGVANGTIFLPSNIDVSLEAPIQTFQYGGQTYRATVSAPEGTNQVRTSYQVLDGSNMAQVIWDPVTKSVGLIIIVPSTGDGAIYFSNGSGGYTVNTGSSAANLLTQVNGVNFVPNGSSSNPAAVTQFSGDLDIRGNLLSLGSWNGDWTQVGLNLTYQDGDSAINLALAIWTASRPHTAWLWEHVNEEGSTPNTKPQMKLGSDNVLTLYKTDGTVGITINPNTGRIRVAPQGDLSMGSFDHEPAAP